MTVQNLFVETLKEKAFLILSHRGFWGGNVLENTRLACRLAYKAGADIAEVDVCRSSDGVYYLFHNGNEPKLLAKEGDFSLLDSKTIDSIDVLNSLGNPSGYHVEKLTDFLSWLPERKLVNLDRSWEYWQDEEFFRILTASQKTNQLLLKSPVKESCLCQLNERNSGIAYMPIITSQEEYEIVLSYPHLPLIGVEVVASQTASNVLEEKWLNRFRIDGQLIVANAEKLGKDFTLFHGLDDDAALVGEGAEGWKSMLSYGVNTIQTDWPNFLNEFRIEIERDVYDIVK